MDNQITNLIGHKKKFVFSGDQVVLKAVLDSMKIDLNKEY